MFAINSYRDFDDGVLVSAHQYSPCNGFAYPPNIARQNSVRRWFAIRRWLMML